MLEIPLNEYFQQTGKIDYMIDNQIKKWKKEISELSA